jgi:hypothetical protein
VDRAGLRGSPALVPRRCRAGRGQRRCWGDPIDRAPGDDIYSWEWWYRSGTAPDDIADRSSRRNYVKYKAERDAGVPPPF